MRTVKQLAIEKELLRQYTELIDQVFLSDIDLLCVLAVFIDFVFHYRIRRKHLPIATVRFSIGWSLSMYSLAALYAFALFLVEHHQLDMHDIIV